MTLAVENAVQSEVASAERPAKITLTAPTSLFHHTLVTKDSEQLKFHAAAALQLQFGRQLHQKAAPSDDRLIASPYNDELHLLDLARLDTPDQLLAKALTIMKPIRDDYATAPYLDAFNWQTMVDFLRDLAAAENHRWKKRKFYVVTFRSQLFPDADLPRLHDLDAHSHQEAMASGGLLKYWFGSKNQSHQNLATCTFSIRESYEKKKKKRERKSS
jgi:hypothetical protein